MKKATLGFLALSLGFALALPAAAYEPPKKGVPAMPGKKDEKAATLKVGDKAPAITIDKWVKGEGAKTFEKGKVYVVEFWGLVNQPSVEALPYMHEAAKKHKTATVMAVASSDRITKPKAIEEFVKAQGDKINYHVGYETKGKMRADWMEAAGVDKLPAVFIIDRDGEIAWIGLPKDMETPLDKAVKKGTTNPKKK